MKKESLKKMKIYKLNPKLTNNLMDVSKIQLCRVKLSSTTSRVKLTTQNRS